MPQYEITVPGRGKFRVNSPTELTDAQAYAAIEQELAKAPAETTIGGNVKEFFKGLVPGAVGLAETAAVGASALLPEETEKAAREKIASIAGAAKAPFAAAPGYEEAITRKLGEAVGSTAPWLAMGPLGIAGRIGAVGVAGAAGAGEARLRAEQAGATEEDRATATALGVAPGLLEVFAPARILSRVPDAAKATGVAFVKRALAAGGEEAAQEAATNFAQNLIAKGIYKPEQELIEGLGESAAYGGATGALVQGLMDLALGRRARGAQQAQQTQEEQEQQRAQREETARLEAERKAKPEYLTELAQRYQSVQEQFKQQQDAIKELKKAGDPASKLQAKQAEEALRTFYREQITPVAKEVSEAGGVAKIKDVLAQQAEQARVAKLTPEEYMLEGMGVKPAAPTAEAPPTSIEEAALQAGAQPAPEAAEPTAAETYAQEQLQAARQMGDLDLTDQVEYLLQDPTQARALVQQRVQLPGLSPKDSNTVLTSLKLKLAQQDKAAAAEESKRLTAEQAQRAETMAAVGRGTTPVQPDMFAQALEERAAVEAEPRPAPTSPEYEREAEITYPEGLSEKALTAQDAENVPAEVTPQAPRTAARTLQRLDELLAVRDNAASKADSAFRGGNREAGVAAMREREAAQTALNNLEQQGGLPAQLLSVRKAQDTALTNIAQLAEDLRSGRTLGGQDRELASSTPKTLVNKINRERDALAEATVREAATTRGLFGKALSKEEAAAAQEEIRKVVDEWVTRSMAQPLSAVNWTDKLLAYMQAEKALGDKPVLSQPWVQKLRADYVKAQLSDALVKRLGRQRAEEIAKGTVELKGAETELPPDTRRAIENKAALEFNRLAVDTQKKALAQSTDPRPLEERQFGAYRAATQVLQEQLRKISARLSSVPETGVRVTPLLKTQFAETEAQKVAEEKGETAPTKAGELVRMREYTSNQIEKALTTRTAPGLVQELLQRVKALTDTGKGNTALLDVSNELAQRVLTGQTGAKTQDYDLQLARKIRDELRAESARAGEGEVAGTREGQAELFPETQADIGYIRTTPRRFEQAPEVRKRREGILDNGEELVAQIKAEFERIDAETEAIGEAQARVAERSDALQSAWQSAVKKAKAQVVKARQAAKQKELKALKAQLEDITKYGIFALDKENTARATALYKAIAEFDVRAEQAVNAAEFLPQALANKWVAFEKKSLEEAKAALAKLPTAVSPQELKRRQEALAQAEKAAGVSPDAQERQERAAMLRRAQEGLGLPGTRVERQGLRSAIEALQARIPTIEKGRKREQAERRLAKLVEQYTFATTPITAEMSAEERAAAAKERQQQVREAARTEAAANAEERARREQRVADLTAQIDALTAAKKRARTDAGREARQKEIDARTKELTLAKAQLEASQEALPRKKGPATAISGAGIGKQRPLRTGIRKALEGASEARRREREEDVQIPGDYDFKFSRGTAEAPSTTATLRKELDAEFGDTKRVELFDTVDALVAANPEYEGRVPSDARGFVDPESGRIFMVAENVPTSEGAAVLLHEVGVHVGMKEALPGAQYQALIKAVETWAARNDGSVESRVAKAALARVEAAKTSKEQRGDETLAYAVEEARKAGVTLSSKGPLGQWLSRIANAFRKVLEKFGVKPKNDLTLQQLVDMAYGAADVELRGPTPPKGGRGKESLRFSYVGEKAGTAQLALRAAKDLTIKGFAPEEVWERTGWFLGPDKKWRYEIDDSTASAPEVMATIPQLNPGETVSMPLDRALQHDTLFKLYPALKDIEVQLYVDPGSTLYGSFNEAKKVLRINGGVAYDPLKIMLHEVQHAIQEIEGFARGSSTETEYGKAFSKKTLAAVRETYVRAYEEATDADDAASATEKVRAIDAGIEAAKKARSTRAKALIDARKKYRESVKALDAFDAAYDAAEEKESLALDAYSDALDAYAQNTEDPVLAQKYKAAKTAYAAAQNPVDFKKYMKQRDALQKQRRAAHQAFVDVRYTADTAMEDEIKNAIQAVAPDRAFTKFATLFIANDAYLNTLGEVEARDVEARLPLSKEERRELRPYASQPQRREELLFSRNAGYAKDFKDVGAAVDKIVAQKKSVMQRVKENFLGMNFRTQYIDKLDPLQKIADTQMDALQATQMMYYLRQYEQRNNFTSQAITLGVPELVEKTRRDGRKEWLIEAQKGAKIKDVVDMLSSKDVVAEVGSPDAANRMFTAYLAAKRAKRVGLSALNFGPDLTQADLDLIEQRVEASPVLRKAFKDARETYNEYNRNLLKFAVQTGSISKDTAANLLAADDYVPYYRERDGVAELVIGGETPIRIGNLKDSPHLQALKGGDEPILDFLTSSVQNTSMLLDMSLRNLSVKNAMWELGHIRSANNEPLARVHKGDGPKHAVRFKIDGDDYHAIVNTDAVGVPSDLLVKGLAGIPTQFPGLIRVLGMPAQLLRRAIVANPAYAARQLFRDSLSATMTSGANMTPVLSALKQIGKKSVLDARGITGGQVFTGAPEDMSRLLAEMQQGRSTWGKAFAKLEAMSMEADAATRRAQYNSYIEQGLSEMEATFMALESMNFSRRGVSPTIQMANTLIPFMNAQIQGLDMLYRAFTGKLPMNERLKIREKLITRGSIMFGASLLYALLMQDDEAYKNATPDQKYGNWFIRVPGLEEPVRVPIPFELGYIFKALPEALVNITMNDKGAEEAQKALTHIVQQTIPGGASYGIPAALKPLIEVGIGKSFFTGRDIESTREQMVEPGQRYRDTTTEVAKSIGEMFNISPIKIEYLIRGYTSSMGMAMLQAISAPIPTTGPEGRYKRMSEYPIIGTFFQPEDAGGIIDATFERVKELQEVQNTYKRLAEREPAKAEQYVQEKLEDFALLPTANKFQQMISKITAQENAIKNDPTMTREEKTELLKELRQLKIEVSRSVQEVFGRKEPQAVPA